jgi:hypothetical protein
MTPDAILVSLEVPVGLINTLDSQTKSHNILKKCCREGPEDSQTIERILKCRGEV